MILHQISNSYGNFSYNARVYTDFSWLSHFHGNYELVYCIRGKAEVSVNGIVSTLFEGELILISPFSIHSLESAGDSEMWVGVFSADFIPNFAEKNKFVKFSKFKCDKRIESVLKEYLFYEGTPDKYLLTACLYMMCNECVKNAERFNTKNDSGFMYGVIDYISENLSEEISLKDIADKLNYEYHYFSALFHKCFGMNFKSFVNIFRFEAACGLLADKAESVTSVCSRCGFGSIRNFNRVFRQFSGLTPGEYRKGL